MSEVTLYHGTTTEAAKSILKDGIVKGDVFLTPRFDVANEYGEEVIEVSVDVDLLMIDFDLGGARLLSVNDANEYDGQSNDKDIYDWISEGQSVGVIGNVEI